MDNRYENLSFRLAGRAPLPRGIGDLGRTTPIRPGGGEIKMTSA